MKFDDLDKKMRVYETAADQCVLPGMFMVARLDGRSFTQLTKKGGQFEVPFDERFRDLMVATTESLMTCGFRVMYGYTESDEISLLFAPDEQLFGRKLRKYNSTLAGARRALSSQSDSARRLHSTVEFRNCQIPNWWSTTFAGGTRTQPETH
jgi:tRNA(His) guanylyltransferase